MNEWREVELGKVAEGVSIYRKGWQECKLGDVVVLNYGKSLPERSRKEGNIPVYSSTGITGWHNVALVSTKGLIVGRKGTIGKVYKSLTPFFPIDTAYYILPNDESYNLDFMFYLLSNAGLEELNEDSAVPGLNRDTAYSQNILLPPIEEQKAIASVLSALDDKIDLLQRQNRTLESLAQALFRHWFSDGAGEDWEEKPLDAIATFLNGLACQKYPPENEIDRLPVLKIKDLRSGLSEQSDWATSDVPEEYIVENGDVVFSWSGSLMVKIWDGNNCVLNQHLFKVTSEQYPKWFYYFWTVHHLQKFIAIAESKATTMGHIKRADLSSSMTFIPAQAELDEMDQSFAPLIDKIVLNNQQIASLTALRDTLLPKLMSGEVRVRV